MSIIHDALKKAQEQRKEKPAGIPYGNASESKKKPQFIVIGIVAIVAVIVIAYLFIPAFHPKKTIPVQQTASVKPVGPAAQSNQPAPQKTPETQPQQQKPPGPATAETAMDTQTVSADKALPKKTHTVAIPGPRLPDTANYSEPVRKRSKAVQSAADEEPLRRIPVRRIEDDFINGQYNEALRLMNAGQIREAQKIFLGILGRKPDHVEALNNMGVIAASSGNKKEAVTYFNKVLEYRPNYPKAYNNIGLVMMSEGDSQLAEEYFRKAISMEPESLEPYLNLSALLCAAKKFPEAAKVLENPINRNIKDFKLYLSYAVVKDNMGQSGEAIKYYRQYLGQAKPSRVRDGVVERLRYLEERGKK